MRLKTHELADSYALAAAEAKKAEKAAATLRKQVLERMEATNTDVLMGADYVVGLSRSLRETLDQTEVRGLLTQQQIDFCTRASTVKTLNCHLRNEAIVGMQEVA